MIYIVWALGDELIPSLQAFKSKEKALKLLAEYQQVEKEADLEFRTFRSGMYIVPHSKTQSGIAQNITNHCFS